MRYLFHALILSVLLVVVLVPIDVHRVHAQLGALFTFDGAPPAPQRFAPTTFDVQRNVSDAYRQVGTEGAGSWMPLMMAGHGADCSPPPATHPINNVEDGVFICSNHVMTAMNAGYGAVYLTPNVQADFTNGEAVIRWDMSTQSTVGRDWIDVWVTPYAENLAVPLDAFLPPYQGPPNRSVHMRLDGTGSSSGGGPFFLGEVIRNFVAGGLPSAGGQGFRSLFVPDAARRDTFELRLSRTHVKLSMPQYANSTWVDSDISPPLDWSSGVVTFGHHAYNPDKGCMPGALLPDPSPTLLQARASVSAGSAEAVSLRRDVGVEDVVRVPLGAGRLDGVPMPSVRAESERNRPVDVLGVRDRVQVRRVDAVTDSTGVVDVQSGRDAPVLNGVGDPVGVRGSLVSDAASRIAVRSNVPEPRPAGVFATTSVNTSPEDSGVKLDGEGKLSTHYKVSTYGVTRPDADNIAVASIIPDPKARQEVASTCSNTWHWDNISISPSRPFTILTAAEHIVDRLTSSTLTFPGPIPQNAYLRFAGHGQALEISADGGASWFTAARQIQSGNRDEHWSTYFAPVPAGSSSLMIRGQASWSGPWAVRDAAIWADVSGPPPPTATPTLVVTPTATATPTATLVPTATPTPGTIQPQTVTFDPAPGPLQAPFSGQYPAGVIDWGSGQWYLSKPWKGFTTNSIGFNGGTPRSATFTFLAPGRLVRLDAFNGGTTTSTVTLACAGQPTVTVSVAVNTLATISTGWAGTCGGPVTVGSSTGWFVNVDNLVIDGGP